MVGQIIVGDVAVPEAAPAPVVEAAPAPVVETTPVADSTPVEYAGVISLPEGSGVPGCDETNECYIPFNVSISAGEEITWSNDDSAAHTVTSGTPSNGPDGNFDSSLFMSGGTYSVTLDTAGEYPYFCMVHPWMIGNISVN
jgi:plastocyanin